MFARERLSNLTLPIDIGNEERFLSQRQKMIEERLIKCYAEEIASVINQLVVENCQGCIIDHPSQRQHPCLMMESDEDCQCTLMMRYQKYLKQELWRTL